MVTTVDEAAVIARLALPEYGIDPEAPLTLLANRENMTFTVPTPYGRGVVRVHRSGYRAPAVLTEELAFIDALHHEGIPVPHFIPLPDGRSFTTVDGAYALGAHQVDLQHHIENSGTFGRIESGVDGTARIDSDDFMALGALIASSHIATQRSGFRLSSTRAAWGLDGLIGPDPTWGDPFRLEAPAGTERDRVLAARDHARMLLAEYGTDRDRFGTIQADLTPENILRTPAGLALIDFNDFGNGWYLFDVATALYCYKQHPRYDEYRRSFLSGYTALRTLTETDLQALTVLMFCRGLTYLGWAADRRGEPIAEQHAVWEPRTVTRLALEVLTIDTLRD